MISFIVPVYNVEKYLKRCLDSILKQTNQDFEIILIDDGSTDSSGKVCDMYAEMDARIVVIHQINSGVSTARNEGLKVASGEYIGFIDGDDWIEPTFVEKIMKIQLNYQQCEAIAFGYYIDYIENSYTLERKFQSTEFFENFDIGNAIERMERSGMFNSVWNKMYSNKLIKKYGISFEKSMDNGEDLIFNCEYFQHISQCVLCEPILYHYIRQGEDTLTKKYNPNLYEKIQLCDKARVNLYKALNMNSDRYQIQLYRYYFSYITSCVYNNYAKNNGLSYRDKLMFYKNLFKNERLTKAVKKMKEAKLKVSLYEKIFIKLFSWGNATVMEFIYEILFFFRNRFNRVYNIFRKGLFQNEG